MNKQQYNEIIATRQLLLTEAMKEMVAGGTRFDSLMTRVNELTNQLKLSA